MMTHRLIVTDRTGMRHELHVADGTTLRRALLDASLSPYVPLTERANCGGHGLCATCGVWIHPKPEPSHWHDRLAAAWGYPRLSCQIRVHHPLTIELPEKRIWGDRRPADAPVD